MQGQKAAYAICNDARSTVCCYSRRPFLAPCASTFLTLKILNKYDILNRKRGKCMTFQVRKSETRKPAKKILSVKHTTGWSRSLRSTVFVCDDFGNGNVAANGACHTHTHKHRDMNTIYFEK